MSRTISEGARRTYGVARVCSAWEVPRSSYYRWAARTCAPPREVEGPRPKRGPKTALDDDALLALIRGYLEGSPFVGEGHRKVYAHLKVVLGLKTSRTRILRLMRENALLSPHRAPACPRKAHDGSITTGAPDLLWGTDGFRVQTVEDGWVWGFVAVDHFNHECVGHHVAKPGTRFEALQPLSMALHDLFGSTGKDAARGLLLRMDHGPQYTSDHFLHQIAYWGIAPSFAFVREPQGNGIAERFIKTLKQQAIYGRVFRDAQEVRQTVAKFVHRYNHQWRVERLGFLTPVEARQLALTRRAA